MISLIPLLVLVFFSSVDVLPTGTAEPIDYLAPSVLALAVMSTAMVSLAIATGYERRYAAQAYPDALRQIGDAIRVRYDLTGESDMDTIQAPGPGGA